jgi:hypothetical protein
MVLRCMFVFVTSVILRLFMFTLVISLYKYLNIVLPTYYVKVAYSRLGTKYIDQAWFRKLSVVRFQSDPKVPDLKGSTCIYECLLRALH